MKLAAKRLPAIDLLRVFAFLCVTLFHFAARIGPNFPANSPARAFCDLLVQFSSVGTNTLLVISTLLLCLALNRGTAPHEALRRRAIRIYPGYLAILSLYIALMMIFPGFNRMPEDPLAAIAYVGANVLLLPGVFPLIPIVTVAWSLSFVAFGYIAVAACYKLVGLAARGPKARLLFWTALYLATFAGVTAGLLSDRWTYLALGCLLSEFIGVANVTPPVLALGAAVLAANSSVLATNLGLALVVLGAQAQPINRLVNLLPVTTLARISYPTFLTHGLVLHAVVLAGPETNTTVDLIALLMAGVAVILAAAKVADVFALQRMTALAELRILRPAPTT